MKLVTHEVQLIPQLVDGESYIHLCFVILLRANVCTGEVVSGVGRYLHNTTILSTFAVFCDAFSVVPAPGDVSRPMPSLDRFHKRVLEAPPVQWASERCQGRSSGTRASAPL